MSDIDYSRPFPVRILADCRPSGEYGPSGNLEGKYGVCVGLYEGIPLIETPFGDSIQGIECWFVEAEDFDGIPLEELQEALGAHVEGIVRKGQELPDPQEGLDARLN
ncbi:hypothetical protein HYU15_02035 [Candidatus Woesearchaeota archaeon]|nr:hypothetical protein [Candidatus Woesearchaeota archaeon]